MTTVLITGASSGLGRALALAYAEPGVQLGLLARRREELDRLASEVKAGGATPHVLVGDVTDADQTQELLATLKRNSGGLDIAIANAGIGEGRRSARFDAKKVAQVFQVNLIGLSNTLLPALEIMRKQGHGTLVGMASVAAYRAMPGSLAYSTSKGAVLTFMEGLAMELEETNIHALALCPGFVRTPLTDKNGFSMPFMLEADVAAERMRRAIDRKKSRYTFPFPMAVAGQLLKRLPRRAVVRLLRKSASHPVA